MEEKEKTNEREVKKKYNDKEEETLEVGTN